MTLPSQTYLLTATLLLVTAPAHAVSDQQFDAIRAMGELNATALHCRYTDETRRMKQALVDTLPKRRALGDAFDQATHESFLEFIRQDAACPPASQLGSQVDAAIRHLKTVFPGE